MARKMADESFHKDQWDHRYASHVAPINQLVDELGDDPVRGRPPYVAPMYGGVNARLLSILRDPGPMTQVGRGSGFVCMENNDPTAENLCSLFSSVGISANDLLLWNAYPWGNINRDPNAAERTAGLKPLKQLIELLPKLQVVMLHGVGAQQSWEQFSSTYPGVAENLEVISTYHTSQRVFKHIDPAVNDSRRFQLKTSFEKAAKFLRGHSHSPARPAVTEQHFQSPCINIPIEDHMARQMADETYRKNQWKQRYAPHIAPINDLVDALKADPVRGWVPYVAPIYGGVNARLLSILHSPGPKTLDKCGSGFISMQNDDPTAEKLCKLLSSVGFSATDILLWNAYPWHTDRDLKVAEIESGLEPLKQLLELLPKLEVVMLHGGDAQLSWKKLSSLYPDVVKKLHVISTFHTSPQALWHKDQDVRATRRLDLENSFQKAAEFLSNCSALL